MKTTLQIITSQKHALQIAGSLAESKWNASYYIPKQEIYIEKSILRMLKSYDPGQRHRQVKHLLLKWDYESIMNFLNKQLTYCQIERSCRIDLLILKLFLDKSTDKLYKRISPGIN